MQGIFHDETNGRKWNERQKFYTAYKLCFVPVYNDIFMGEVKKI